MFGDFPIWPLIEAAPIFLCAGLAIGLLAGLFGIGGGAITVPVYFETFRLLGTADDVAMPLAVGSSLATIVPTAILSARDHARRGTVDTAILKIWAVPIIIGVVAGSVIARFADAAVFQSVFMVVSLAIAAKLLSGNPKLRFRETMPGPVGTSLYGAATGILSALMGVGGGAISTMILTLNGKPIIEAVSTSAAVGVLIAAPGTVGYILAGWGQPGLPSNAVGYISLAALVLTLPTALLTTRLGVRLAHSVSSKLLSRLFGIFLLGVAIRFLFEIVG